MKHNKNHMDIGSYTCFITWASLSHAFDTIVYLMFQIIICMGEPYAMQHAFCLKSDV